MSADRSTRDSWSAWLRHVVACGVIAAAGSIAVWGLVRTLSLAAPPAVLVAAMAGVAAAMSGGSTGSGGMTGGDTRAALRRERAWRCLVAAGGASVVMCVGAAAAVAPWCLLVVAAALALTTPPVRARVRRSLPPGGTGPARPGEGDAAAPSRASARVAPGRGANGVLPVHSRIADLDTPELCHLWRVTFWMVRDVRAPTRTVCVVDVRQAILDELERRHPEEVGRWLRSGRHGADGPARYL